MFKSPKVEEQYNRILNLCHSAGITKSALAKQIGKPTSLFSDIPAGRVGLSGEVQSRIAEYFGVSVDYIMNGTIPPMQETMILDIKTALFSGHEDVTDEMWEQIVCFAQMLKKKYINSRNK